MSVKLLPKTVKKTVSTAGTRVPLAASKTLVRSILIQADDGNTLNVYVGGSDVDSTNGIIITSGNGIELEAPTISTGAEDLDLADLYVDADTNGNSVTVMYLERSSN